MFVPINFGEPKRFVYLTVTKTRTFDSCMGRIPQFNEFHDMFTKYLQEDGPKTADYLIL